MIPIFDQHFDFPADTDLPADIRHITRYNGVRWVHDYQEACMDKVERFIKGELNRTPSIGQQQVRLVCQQNLWSYCMINVRLRMPVGFIEKQTSYFF